MSEKSMIFGDRKINKGAFNKDKKLIQADSKDVDKILVPKKEPCGKRKTYLQPQQDLRWGSLRH